VTDLPDTVRIGTRGSALARWQTDHVAGLLKAAHPALRVEVVVLTTRGDQVLDTPLPLIGGKGLFTAELESTLRDGEIDLAVHSLKDLPTDNSEGLTIGAIPLRAAVEDVLVSRAGYTLDTLPAGAAVGTSSRRRAAQLLHARADLECLDVRGNVDTRIRKALDSAGPYDAVVLARAGLDRLGRESAVSQVLPLDVMLPAPGQGALAIQCRDEVESLALLKPLDHWMTRAAVTAERAFLAGLGGGCSVPVAAHARMEGQTLHLQGRVSSLDGARQVDVQRSDVPADAESIGHMLARDALAQGAEEILEVTP
jgi:hydroxymethylbilane synthase